MTEDYQVVLKEEFDRFMADKCGRKSKEEVQQKLITMQTLLQLYSEGVERFEGDLRAQLEKFLLRSFGQEVTTIATTFTLMEAGMDENSQVNIPSTRIALVVLHCETMNHIYHPLLVGCRLA